MPRSVLLKPPPKKLLLPEGATAASGAPPDGQAPLFETDLHETLGIRKFLIMSMEDLKDQLKRASQDPGVSKRAFNDMKASATILTAWMSSAMITVDTMLAEASARSDKPLAEDLPRNPEAQVN